MNTQDPIGNFQIVEVEKSRLVQILKDNRDTHLALYQASLSGYYEKVETYYRELSAYSKEQSDKFSSVSDKLGAFSKEFEAKKVEAEFGKPVAVVEYPQTNFKLKLPAPVLPAFPVSYESSYNESLKKLELSIHNVFRLSESEFQQYVMNNWQWKRAFVDNALANLNGTRMYGTGMYMGQAVSGILAEY